MKKKHCCRCCEPDSGYDVELIKIEEERRKNANLIDQYFFKEEAKRRMNKKLVDEP